MYKWNAFLCLFNIPDSFERLGLNVCFYFSLTQSKTLFSNSRSLSQPWPSTTLTATMPWKVLLYFLLRWTCPGAPLLMTVPTTLMTEGMMKRRKKMMMMRWLARREMGLRVGFWQGICWGNRFIKPWLWN